MNANQSIGRRFGICKLASAVSLCVAGMVRADPVAGNLLYEFSAYTDSDGSNGWQSSVQPDASPETLPLVVANAGGPTHVVEGNAKYFRSNGSSQAFTSNFGSSSLTSAPSYTDWSLELWIRRNGASFHPTTEQAVAGLASNDVGNFIFLYNNDANGGELTLDHRDRRVPSNRNTVVLSGTNLSDAAWHHVVLSYDDAIEGSAYGALNVYFDGNTTPVFQKLNSDVDNKQGGGSTFDMMSAFAIQAGEANRNFNGDIGLMRFYSDVLTPQEANQNYADRAVAYLGLSWNVNADGNWSAPENWTGAVPNQAGVTTKLTTAINATRTITMDIPVTVGELRFDSGSTYIIAGAGPLTLDSGGGGNAAINVVTGQHTISTPIILSGNTSISVAASSSLAISGAVTANGHVISKAGGGSAQLENLRAAGLAVNAGSVKISAKGAANDVAGTSKLTSLSIATGATLDLTNNSMIVDYAGASVEDNIRQALSQGRLTTSASTGSTGLGYGEASTILGPTGGTFAGQEADAESILVKFTYTGDANLDGAVTSADFSALATNFNSTSAWTGGDFNYDGIVNALDFNALASNFGMTPIPAAALGSLVPEPASLGVFTVCATFLLHRRRRFSSRRES